MTGSFDFARIALIAIPVIIAITLHEAAHGFVALYFGDSTAKNRGRLTLNPLKHIDLFGTILLPALLLLSHVGFIFGYAKPVPVDFSALRHPKRDMALVAAAGPAMNVLLAVISASALYATQFVMRSEISWWQDILNTSVQINLILAVFNMIPIPPLDGSKVLAGLLPNSIARPYLRLGRFGVLPLIIFLIAMPFIMVALGYSFQAAMPFLHRMGLQ